jgi:hypothetical protein
VHFTGAPAFPAATCSTCHTDGPSRVGVRLESDDTSIFSTGYQPGSVYLLQVVLEHESLGAEYDGPARCGSIPRQSFVPCNSNGFALEVDDSLGDTAGSLCPSTPGGDGSCQRLKGAPTVASTDGTAIASAGYLEADPTAMLPAGFENAAVTWRFYWIAPPAGTGPVTFHIGAVDGNGGLGTEDVPQDLAGDDAVEAHLTIPEAGGAALVASSGCAVPSRPGGLGAATLALVGIALALARARRTRR